MKIKRNGVDEYAAKLLRENKVIQVKTLGYADHCDIFVKFRKEYKPAPARSKANRTQWDGRIARINL